MIERAHRRYNLAETDENIAKVAISDEFCIKIDGFCI